MYTTGDYLTYQTIDLAQTKYCLINKKLYKCTEATNLP